MFSPSSHFDHSYAHCHLVPLLTTLFSQVWNNISNTRRTRRRWVEKKSPDQVAESIEKDSEHMMYYTIDIVTSSQSWWFVDESTSAYKPLYDDAVLRHSQKIFNIIMGYDECGNFWNANARGPAGLAKCCGEIHRIRTQFKDKPDEARRELHERVEQLIDRKKCDRMCWYETRKKFIANYLRSHLGDRHMANYLITHGAPWLLQTENQLTKRALQLPTADKSKIHHLCVDFLKWWGRAMHTLSHYNNSHEVKCARIASAAPRFEKERKHRTKVQRAKQLHRDLQNGSRQYSELSKSQEKLLALALWQENRESNPGCDTTPQLPWICNPFTSWTLAFAWTEACQTPTPWPVEPKTYAVDGDGNTPCVDQALSTPCFPPGLNLQSFEERPLSAAIALQSPQEFDTQADS